MKFVHAADLHLDSPMRGLTRYEGAPVEAIRGATRRAMENLVGLCAEEQVDFLLLAGDLYDGDWRDYSTGLFFAAQMSRLREAGVRVFLVRGNHDAQSRITKHLVLPDNVVELSTREPQTVVDEALGLAVHGQGFATGAVTEDLAAAYPDPCPELFNVGLLHTSLDGRPGHGPYAPTSAEVLARKGYDYWALGHVHKREIVGRDPWIVFPGNLQGRHARETGSKGASLVTVVDGVVTDVDHRPLDVVRWTHLEVDATTCDSPDEVLECAGRALAEALETAGGRLLAARLRLSGVSAAHRRLAEDHERHEAALRALATDLGSGAVWLERIRFDTRAPFDLELLRSRDDPIGQLARAFEDLRADPAGLSELRKELAELERKLPREACEGEEGLRFEDPQTFRDALGEIEQMLLPRLLSAEEA